MLLTLASLGYGLGSCGDAGPTTISEGIPGTRVATPGGQSFGDVERGGDPAPRTLLGRFVLRVEQLERATTEEVRIQPTDITFCVDCSGLSPGDPSDAGARGLGTYETDNFALRLRIPEITSGQMQVDARIEVESTTQFISPGQGVRLQVRSASLKTTDPEPDAIAASPVNRPLDYTSTQITQGLSNTQSFTLIFDTLAPLTERELHLEIELISPIPDQALEPGRLALPPEGQMYVGIEGSASLDTISRYETTTGSPPAWVRFESQGSTFPASAANTLRQQGSLPYIRLTLPSDTETLEAIRDGQQAEDWEAWLEAIRDIRAPVMVEIGQSNGDPSALRSAYRYLNTLRQQRNITNLTWAYHLDLGQADPDGDYPGDDMIDWLNLNMRVETNSDGTWRSLESHLDQLYPLASAVSATTPILVTLNSQSPQSEPEAIAWAEEGLPLLTGRRWPRIRALTWGSGWDPTRSPRFGEVFRATLTEADPVLNRVRVTSADGEVIQPITGTPIPGSLPTAPINDPFLSPSLEPIFEQEVNPETS